MKKRLWILVLISFILTTYIITDTFALFEKTEEKYTQGIRSAKWTIKLNNHDISKGNVQTLTLNQLTYETNENVDSGYIAPGVSGYFDLTLDAKGTEVSVKYDITFNIDTLPYADNITFRIEKESSNTNIIKTDVNTYSGVLTIGDINDGKDQVKFKVYVEWEDVSDGSRDEDDTKLGKVRNQKLNIPIQVRAEQYLGEEIIEYIEP